MRNACRISFESRVGIERILQTIVKFCKRVELVMNNSDCFINKSETHLSPTRSQLHIYLINQYILYSIGSNHGYHRGKRNGPKNNDNSANITLQTASNSSEPLTF